MADILSLQFHRATHGAVSYGSDSVFTLKPNDPMRGLIAELRKLFPDGLPLGVEFSIPHFDPIGGHSAQAVTLKPDQDGFLIREGLFGHQISFHPDERGTHFYLEDAAPEVIEVARVARALYRKHQDRLGELGVGLQVSSGQTGAMVEVTTAGRGMRWSWLQTDAAQLSLLQTPVLGWMRFSILPQEGGGFTAQSNLVCSGGRECVLM